VRRYYKHSKSGDYSHLSDESLGIETDDRMDLFFESELINKASEISYQKSGQSVSDKVSVSDQTVMNSIRRLEKIENNSVEIKRPKKKIKILYIEADEDHVSMQDGSNQEIKLVYVHEGKELVSKGRYELQNCRYFSGSYRDSEELWLEVAEYLEEAYEMDNIEKIYLSGDGANWIKEGLNWIVNSRHVLDYYHLSKYVKKATAHMSYTEPILWGYIDRLDKQSVKDLFKIIIDQTETETKKNAVRDSRRYVLNNWESIERRYEKEYIGCSAEGHVSHILSARLSSRPLGWCTLGADQMARLRAFKANGGNVYDFMLKKKKANRKEERIIALDKRVVKKKLNDSAQECLDNITILNKGKRTWAWEFLNSIRGA